MPVPPDHVPQDAAIINRRFMQVPGIISAMEDVVSEGTGTAVDFESTQIAGKTGTTDETWDIWFDGFTPKYAAALWIGTDNNIELNTTSATAAKLWSTVMSQVKRAKGGEYKSRPDNVIVKNGEYYTTGTQPPDPPPEKKEKDKSKDKDKKDDGSSQDSGKEPAQEPAKEDKKN